MSKAIVISAIVAAASAAVAGPLVGTFSYENLESNYNAGTGSLVTTANLLSTGSVSRLVGPTSTARFNQGFASFTLDLTVSNVVGSTADGNGTVIGTDLDGDTFTANVDGNFLYVPVVGPIGIVFFDGIMSNFFFNNESGDGTFDGNSSLISTDFTGIASQPFLGGIQRLSVGNIGFFDTSWSTQLAEVDGQIIPAPAVLAGLGLSLAVAGRRRR